MQIRLYVKLFVGVLLGLIVLSFCALVGIGIAAGRADFEAQTVALQNQSEADTVYFTMTPSCTKDSPVLVGERIRVQAYLDHSFGYAQTPELRVDLPEGLLMAGTLDKEPILSFSHYTHALTFDLLPYREGDYEAIKVLCEVKGRFGAHVDTARVYTLPPIHVVLPPEGVQLPDFAVDSAVLFTAGQVKPLLPPGITRWWIYGLAALIVLAAGIAFVLYAHRTQKEKPRLPAWVTALNALETLQNGIRKGAVSSFKAVTVLTDIVRDYISERYAVGADAMTTAEFFVYLESRRSPLSVEHKTFLKNFLTRADMVKFAGVSASESLIIEAMDSARNLVKETTPNPHETEVSK